MNDKNHSFVINLTTKDNVHDSFTLDDISFVSNNSKFDRVKSKIKDLYSIQFNFLNNQYSEKVEIMNKLKNSFDIFIKQADLHFLQEKTLLEEYIKNSFQNDIIRFDFMSNQSANINIENEITSNIDKISKEVHEVMDHNKTIDLICGKLEEIQFDIKIIFSNSFSDINNLNGDIRKNLNRNELKNVPIINNWTDNFSNRSEYSSKNNIGLSNDFEPNTFYLNRNDENNYNFNLEKQNLNNTQFNVNTTRKNSKFKNNNKTTNMSFNNSFDNEQYTFDLKKEDRRGRFLTRRKLEIAEIFRKKGKNKFYL